jgi:hypothetical protein
VSSHLLIVGRRRPAHITVRSLKELSTIKTESVDFVRMSCLGTSIPESDWPIVLTEVRRILQPGGVIEIIDDELYPAHLPEDPINIWFRKMLVEGYAMPKKPHETIENAMEIAFGANEKKYFRVELPSPNFTVVETEEARRGGNVLQSFLGKKDVTHSVLYDTPSKAQRVLGLDNGSSDDRPFLIIHPYKLCRFDASEVRMAACGYMHKVMSCRASLIDSIVGSDEEGEKFDEVTNALWEYER